MCPTFTSTIHFITVIKMTQLHLLSKMCLIDRKDSNAGLGIVYKFRMNSIEFIKLLSNKSNVSYPT